MVILKRPGLVGVALLAAGSAFVLASCGSGNAKPTKIVLHNPKALFVGKADGVAKGAKATVANALFEILPDDTVQGVPFLDESGNEVTVDVWFVEKISEDYIGIGFCVPDGVLMSDLYSVVLEKSEGIFWDLTDYSVQTAVLHEGYLYLKGNPNLHPNNGTMYRIDMSTRTATPMNNPEYDDLHGGSLVIQLDDYFYQSFDRHPFIVTAGGWVHANTTTRTVALDPAGGIPVLSWMDDVLGMGQGTRIGLIFGEDTDFYNIEIHDGSGTLTVTYGRLDGVYNAGPDLHVNNDGYAASQYYVHTSHVYTIYDRDRYLVLRDGYFITSSGTGGGVDFQWVAKDLSFLGDELFDNDTPIYKDFSGSRLLWRSGNTIKKADFVNDTAVTDLVTDPDMIDWWVVGDTAMFTAYITGLDVGTYKVEDDLSVTLVSNSDMEVTSIVEFTLP